MAGKKKIEKEGSSWIGEVEKYSRQIWLAGLGAYSKISNDGSKLFESLVKDGEKAEKQTKAAVDKTVDTAKASTKSRVGDVKDLALGKWGELEGAFDKRLNSAISRLGVPSRNEVKALHSKVDLLTKQIERLTGASVTPTSQTTSTKSASRTTAKPLTKAVAKPVAKAASTVASKTAAAKPAVAKAATKPVAAASKAAAATASKAKSVAAKPAAKKPATAKKPAAAKPAAASSPSSTASTAPADTAHATTAATPSTSSSASAPSSQS